MGAASECTKCKRKLISVQFLPCFHFICTDCVHELLDNSEDELMRCPSCEETFDIDVIGNYYPLETVVAKGKTTDDQLSGVFALV